ncbi:glutathione S-transferase family protein [Kordiimonas lacus]|uniref:Glutathione S-transferase n=1 Tax=Kordiimonas lacus TaxID=637679 RepID=A0A1G6XTV7_9PROT|nr:glutathione S-transferase family protein [Kordiimonas lacus]SDD80845.1 glutathione S-transferase [Kordiimonas lacus]
MSDLKIIVGTKTYSSWSLRGWLAVRHTGLPFEEIKLRLDTPEFYEAIKDYSPTSCVPALLDGDVRVWDSLAIIDYCARIAPEKFWWPEDKAAFANARSIVAEMHSGFMGLRGNAPMNMRGRWTGLALSDAVQKDVTRIDAIWTDARSRFGAGGHFLYGAFGAADMMYAPVVSRFETYGIEVSETARTYMNAVLNHPYIKEWKADAATETQIVHQDEIPADATSLG